MTNTFLPVESILESTEPFSPINTTQMIIDNRTYITIILIFTANFEGYKAETSKSAKELKKSLEHFSSIYGLKMGEYNPSGNYRDDLHPIGDYEFNFSLKITSIGSLADFANILHITLLFKAKNKQNYPSLDLEYGIQVL